MKKVYTILLIILTTIVSSRYIYLHYNKHDYYYEKYLSSTNKIVYGINSPRGRILDRNGKVLVDNIGVKTIIYYNIDSNNITKVANLLNELTDFPEASESNQKEYYLKKEATEHLLTKEEKELYERRKLSSEEIEDIKLSRIKPNYTKEQRKYITIYNLLTSGYSNDFKIIKEDIKEDICAKVNSSNIPGLTCEYTTKRKYNYNTLNDIYGKVGKITKENKDYYLKLGYNLNDQVGLSYLEKEYDQYLRGKKAIYKINKDNTLSLVKKSVPGNDIYLSIDIDMQLEINNIIKKHINSSSNMKKTKYFNSTYVIVSNPNTGEIIASTGLMKVKNTYYDVSTNLLTNSFIVGSVVKGASHTVGYQNNLINPNLKRKDSCIKLYQVPAKCSYHKLGYINDIIALKMSSNSYQFQTAIKLTGSNYKYNMKLKVTDEHFATYRKTFAEFGLGSSTGIDLENETTGIRGNKISGDLLLNLSIGQYDTYTPLALTNYINTIATKGKRYSLHYLKEVKKNNEVIYTYKPKLLNQVKSNFPRIIEGFRQVIYDGTGRGSANIKYKPAGKTGTAEVVYNKETITINQSTILFAPYNKPKYSIVVISPNISYESAEDVYVAPINSRISKEVSKLVFEN